MQTSPTTHQTNKTSRDKNINSKTLGQALSIANSTFTAALAFFTKALIAFAVTAANSSAYADGVLSSDFVFQMNNSVLQSPDLDLSKLLNGSQTLTLPDRVVQSQVPVSISKITVQLNYKFATPYQYPKLGTEINLASTDLSGTIKIGKLEVDAVGDEVRNGILVHWRLQGICTDIVVGMPSGSAQMMGSLALLVGSDGLPSLTIPWFQVNWNDGAWKVQSMNCSGAKNFYFKAKDGIEDYLKSSTGFASQFKEAIDKMASDYQDQARAKILAPITLNLGLTNVTAVLKPAKIISLVGEQFQVRGLLDLTFASGTYGKKVSLTEASVLPPQSGYTLSLPKTFLSAFNTMANATGFYNMQKKGTEISAFQSLRVSKLELSYVWTEVYNTSLDRDFYFDITPDAAPELSALAWDGASSLSGTLDTSLTINSWVQNADANGAAAPGYQKFNQITTPISAAYTLSFTQETAGATLNIAFSKFALNVLGFWDASYHPSNPNFDGKTIGDSLTGSMTKTPTQKLIGSFSLTPALNLSPSAFRKTGNWLLIDMTP